MASPTLRITGSSVNCCLEEMSDLSPPEIENESSSGGIRLCFWMGKRKVEEQRRKLKKDETIILSLVNKLGWPPEK